MDRESAFRPTPDRTFWVLYSGLVVGALVVLAGIVLMVVFLRRNGVTPCPSSSGSAVVCNGAHDLIHTGVYTIQRAVDNRYLYMCSGCGGPCTNSIRSTDGFGGQDSFKWYAAVLGDGTIRFQSFIASGSAIGTGPSGTACTAYACSDDVVANEAESFEVKKCSDGTYTLKSAETNKYLTAKGGTIGDNPCMDGSVTFPDPAVFFKIVRIQ